MKFKKLIKKLGKGKRPLLAVLIDPDKFNPDLIKLAENCSVDCFLLGGSKLVKGEVPETIRQIKKLSDIPVVLFPGDETQLSEKADGLLLLSLLSGRNPDYLIGKHIRAAPLIRSMRLKHLSTAYLLISGGKTSETEKVTRTKPLNSKDEVEIVNTAMAAEQLGFKAIYLEAGSGARNTVADTLVSKIKSTVDLPLIVGGGIDSAEKTQSLIDAGANMIVVGNALEKNVYLLTQISSCFR